MNIFESSLVQFLATSSCKFAKYLISHCALSIKSGPICDIISKSKSDSSGLGFPFPLISEDCLHMYSYVHLHFGPHCLYLFGESGLNSNGALLLHLVESFLFS